MARIRIESNGVGYGTRVYVVNANGASETLDNVMNVSWSVDASGMSTCNIQITGVVLGDATPALREPRFPYTPGPSGISGFSSFSGTSATSGISGLAAAQPPPLPNQLTNQPEEERENWDEI